MTEPRRYVKQAYMPLGIHQYQRYQNKNIGAGIWVGGWRKDFERAKIRHWFLMPEWITTLLCRHCRGQVYHSARQIRNRHLVCLSYSTYLELGFIYLMWRIRNTGNKLHISISHLVSVNVTEPRWQQSFDAFESLKNILLLLPMLGVVDTWEFRTSGVGGGHQGGLF